MARAANAPARTIITHADNRGAQILPLVTDHQSLITVYMGRRLEQLEEFGIDVVLERRHGVRASVLRGILYALSFIYDRLVQLRLYLYRKRIFRERTLGCLVISIGNLTVGGTGKTPIVEKFARALQAGGRRVAILSRGYKSVPRKTRLAEPVSRRFRASAGCFRWKIPAARFAHRRRRALHARAQLEGCDRAGG